MLEYPLYLKSTKKETYFVYFDEERYIMLSQDDSTVNFNTWSINWGVNYGANKENIPMTSIMIERKICRQITEEEFYEKFIHMFKEFDLFRGITPQSV